MRITIEGKYGEDFPLQARDAVGFEESVKIQTILKLGLRSTDEVVVKVD
jgi:hypothetical protein